jgi:superfamily II RNA helicase
VREYQGFTLDRFQQEALDAIARNENVIVAAPTGAGKSLIAHYAIEKALEQGKRVIYTAPIKALSNQKYRELSEQFPGRVGISTGDVSIDSHSPAVIMTTEIFRNTIFDDPERIHDVAWVIFDEVHYLDDADRGTVWEESLIFAPPNVRVVALSATVSNLDEFAAWLTEVRGTPARVVLETHRPVPLTVHVASTEGGVRPLSQVAQLRPGPRERARGRRPRVVESGRGFQQNAWRRLVGTIAQRGDLPCLFFLYSRDACERLAEACSGERLLRSREAGEAARAEFQRLARAFDLDPRDPVVAQLERLAGRGIAYHHAGILPALKEVIERLFTANHIRLLCATETFALGVNMPARSVAFEGLQKFNGRERVPLKTREYQQMAGRAGRRGLDKEGTVYITFDPNRDEPTVVTSIVNGRVEPVESQFNLSYGTLVALWGRLGDKIYEACERSFASFRSRQRRIRRGAPATAVESRCEAAHPLERHAEHETRQRARRHGRGPELDDEGQIVGGRRRRRRPGRDEREHARRAAGLPPPAGGGGRWGGMVAQVKTKLSILRQLGYIEADAAVTRRGTFAMQVFGHELEVTELVWSGVLDGLSPEQLCVVATAVVFEKRKGAWYGGPDPAKLVGIPVFRKAQHVVGDLFRLESELGVRQPVKLLDWDLSGVVWAWAQGAEFSELRDFTDASDGDIVRVLRQAIQVLRLIQEPLKVIDRADLAEGVRAAQGLLKRGLVDAEWQLRRAAELGPDNQVPPEVPPEAPIVVVTEPTPSGRGRRPVDPFSEGLYDDEELEEEPAEVAVDEANEKESDVVADPELDDV